MRVVFLSIELREGIDGEDAALGSDLDLVEVGRDLFGREVRGHGASELLGGVDHGELRKAVGDSHGVCELEVLRSIDPEETEGLFLLDQSSERLDRSRVVFFFFFFFVSVWDQR